MTMTTDMRPIGWADVAVVAAIGWMVLPPIVALPATALVAVQWWSERRHATR